MGPSQFLIIWVQNHTCHQVIDNWVFYDQIYKIDVWALGVTMYQLLTNNLPFDSINSVKNASYKRHDDGSDPQLLLDLIFKINPVNRCSIQEVDKFLNTTISK